MAKKVTNFSEMIGRVTASCLLHPLGSSRFPDVLMTPDHYSSSSNNNNNNNNLKSELANVDHFDDDLLNYTSSNDNHNVDNDEEESGEFYVDAPQNHNVDITINNNNNGRLTEFNNRGGERDDEMGVILEQVFEAMATMKKAYGKLQEAHNPWDAAKMRVADEEVVAELRRMALLRERFRRRGRIGRGVVVRTVETVKEVVAPYEAVMEELKNEVKVKDVELEELKAKISVLSNGNGVNGNAKKIGRGLSRKKGASFALTHVASSPTPDIFEATMTQVRETSKSFTSHLLSLMRSAHWDISAAVRSIEAAISTTASTTLTTANPHQHQPKHALESYILRKIFQGFDHETFYMDGTLSSLLHPSQFRQECFSKFRDMKSMDPNELLGILPSSPFGVFSSKKYQDIVHPKMEESLFGNIEQRNQLLKGVHPRTEFYSEFLGLAKAVWLLHLLAFSLDPAPSHFEASRGAEFHSDYMDSVVRFPGGKVPAGQIVGFPVSPGFKLGNGSIVKARVYLVPRN